MNKKMWIFAVSLGFLLAQFLFPAMDIQADGPEYTQVNVDNGKDLKTYLEQSGDYLIVLDDDIDYDDQGDYAYWATISGNKKLDLNGHGIKVHNDDVEKSTLLRIPAGAMLIIDDSKESADSDDVTITYNGYINSEGSWKGRNIVEVSGKLFMNGGSLEAGRSKCVYIARQMSYYYLQTEGTAVTVMKGGTFVMTDGWLSSRGYGFYAVDCRSGSKTYINNGNLTGRGEGSVFRINENSECRVAAADINITTVHTYCDGHRALGIYGEMGLPEKNVVDGAFVSPEKGLEGHECVIVPATTYTTISAEGTVYTGDNSGESCTILDSTNTVITSDLDDDCYFGGLEDEFDFSGYRKQFTWIVKDESSIVGALVTNDFKPSVDLMTDFSGFTPVEDKVYSVYMEEREYLGDLQNKHIKSNWLDVAVRTNHENDVQITAVNFPDSYFRAYVSDKFDADSNGWLDPDERANATKIHLNVAGENYQAVESLEGIQYLTNVVKVYANHTALKSFDGTGLPYLMELDLSESPIDSLNISTNHILKALYLEDTDGSLESVDLSGNPRLKHLGVYRSSLKEIDISPCPYLVEAALYGECQKESYYALYSIPGVSKLYLSISGNIEDVYVAHIEEAFPCETVRNMITASADFNKDGLLSTVEAASCTELSFCDEEDNVDDISGIEYLPNLEWLDVGNCRITEADFSKNTKLKTIYIYSNCLKELDVSMLPNLKELWCHSNRMEKLVLGDNTALKTLDCSINRLESLTLAGLGGLETLVADDNDLYRIDLSANPALTCLDVENNNISELSVSANTELKTLRVLGNKLTDLDLSCNKVIETLTCAVNDIEKLDISNNPELISHYRTGSRLDVTDPETGTAYLRYKDPAKTTYLSIDLDTAVYASVTSGWQKIDGIWYYSEDGTTFVTGWKKVGSVWYYFGSDCAMVNGWQKIDGSWYYFKDSGAMATGWLNDGGKWYYMGTSGAMQTGWVQVSGKWYLLGANGVMKTGWQKSSGKWYLLGANGVMKTGWQKVSGSWYYLGTDGVMQTGWKTIGGKTYYFWSNGVMAANEWVQGYRLNADGTWTYPYKASWKKDTKGWYYQDTSGWYAKNETLRIDGKNYTFDAAGYMK